MYTTRTYEVLNSLGFTERERGIYLNKNENHKIVLAADGIYGYSVMNGDNLIDYLEMHLNFVPGDKDEDKEFLTYILKRVFFL